MRKIKTLIGWINSDDLKIGDEVASIDGQPNFVTAVLPLGTKRTFRVTLSDGRSVEASGDHLWWVHFVHQYKEGCGSSIHNGWLCFSTESIRAFCLNGSHRNGHRKVFVPLMSGDFGSSDPLPISPWLLGVLLGDGGLTRGTPVITTADHELIGKVATLIEPLGLRVKPVGKVEKHCYSYRLSGSSVGRGHSNALMTLLQDLGLRGADSATKFIPAQYLDADKHSLWELLQGLLDTDGTRGGSNEISFTSTSVQLAKGVQQLVRSLGGLSEVFGPKQKWCSYKGEKREGKPAYYVSTRLPEREKAFYLERKTASARQHQPRLTIEKIDYIGEQPAQSIIVSHASGLVIVDQFIVTRG